MSAPILKEVNTPFLIQDDDDAIGHEPVVIRSHGHPIAVLMPYEQYQELNEQTPKPLKQSEVMQGFEREETAFKRLLPALLESHRGEWVAIVDENPALFGKSFADVIVPVRKKYGQRPVYVDEIIEQPRVYKIPSPRIVRE